MKPRILAFAAPIAVLALAGCSRNPGVPEIFKTQLVQYLQQGGKLSSMIETGVRYDELKEGAATTRATFSLLDQTWPDSFSGTAHESFRQAEKGYLFALQLWQLHMQNADEPPYLPAAPNKNGYKEIDEYTNHTAKRGRFAGDDTVYITADNENIQILMTLAAAHFNQGRAAALAELQ